MESVDLQGLTTRDIYIVKSLIRSLKKPQQRESRKIDLNEFSFKKARRSTENLKGNLSDAILDERESYV